MIGVTITISGPGTTFNYELEIIKRALEAAHLKVEVVNEYPSEESPDEMLKRVERQIAEGDLRPRKVKLIADHIPWGG